ncbi:hypothetical protein F4860DRAFT_459384 [Xylaria cubensis]|nr:hypothetical protein F4860DRAFT_459384 [Xylaria cubensis]
MISAAIFFTYLGHFHILKVVHCKCVQIDESISYVYVAESPFSMANEGLLALIPLPWKLLRLACLLVLRRPKSSDDQSSCSGLM